MRTVLLVNDEPQILELLSTFFRLEGFKVAACNGVATALRHLQYLCVDLVVTDYDMEDGTGETVINAAKEWCPGTPSLLITGNLGGVPILVRQMAKAVIEKPELIDPLRQWLRGDQPQVQSPNSQGDL